MWPHKLSFERFFYHQTQSLKLLHCVTFSDILFSLKVRLLAWILDPYLIIHEKSQLIWAWNYTHGLDKIIHLSSLGFEIWQLAPMDQILVFQVNFKSTRAYCLFVKENVDWGFVLGWCLINSTNVLIPYFHFGLKDTTIRFETGLHSSTNNIDKTG